MILFAGPQWWGSDARALAAALRRLGHGVIAVDYRKYYPVNWSILPLKAIRRLIRPLCRNNFNRAIVQHLRSGAVDFLLVCKGTLLSPGTLARFREAKTSTYCFYPDVSFLDHGAAIWECLPYYDCVFTTKSFHMDDPAVRCRTQDLRLVMHGFDADVHRPLVLPSDVQAYYSSDASFVGHWSPEKEKHLAALLRACPNRAVRIWGHGWGRAADNVRSRWQGRGAYGDELVAVYQSSKINLGLLSEAGGGTKVGDQTTARTWQIPACGAFLLHKHTTELLRYFAVPSEVASFGSPADLALKVEHYLQHDTERQATARAGRARCIGSGYSYERVAEEIVAYHAEHRHASTRVTAK